MVPTPLVTVAVPTYNRAHVLAQCLESIFAQSYRPLEVIVVDDGSTDGTQDLLSRYAGRVKSIRQENRGVSAARNRAARAASGELIAWMDSDDLCHPDRIAIEVDILRQLPEVALVSSDFSSFDASGLRARSYIRSYYGVIDKTPGGFAGIYPQTREISLGAVERNDPNTPPAVRVFSGRIHDPLVWGSCVHPPTVLLRREAASATGDLDESLLIVSEWDYLIRLARREAIAYADLPLLSYRESPDQISSERNIVLIRREILRVVEKVAQSDEAFVRRNYERLRRRLAYCHLALASVLAAASRAEAFSHLVQSVRMGHFDGLSLRTLSKLLLPLRAIDACRALLRRVRARRAAAG